MASTNKKSPSSPSKLKKLLKGLGFSFLGILILLPIVNWAWHNIDTSEPDTSALRLAEVDTSAKGNGVFDLIFNKEDFWFDERPTSNRDTRFPRFFFQLHESFKVQSYIPNISDGFLVTSYNIEDVRLLVEKNRPIIERIERAANSRRIQLNIFEQPSFDIKFIDYRLNLMRCSSLMNFKTWLHLYRGEGKEALETAKLLHTLGVKILEGTSFLWDSSSGVYLSRMSLQLMRHCSLTNQIPLEQIKETITYLSNVPDFKELIIEDIKCDYLAFSDYVKYLHNAKKDPKAEIENYGIGEFTKESSFLVNETLTPIANRFSEFVTLLKEKQSYPFHLKSKDPEIIYSKVSDLRRKNKFLRGRNAAGKQALVRSFAIEIDDLVKTILNYQMFNAMTRIHLSLFLYYQDKKQLPDQLSDLVPNYIESIPKDPISKQEFIYKKEERILYSLGFEGKDRGGNPITNSNSLKYQGRGRNQEVPLESPIIPIHDEEAYSLHTRYNNPTLYLDFPGMPTPVNRRFSELLE